MSLVCFNSNLCDVVHVLFVLFFFFFFCITNCNAGVLVTALPCRLQNDSPPNSIEQPHLNKENDSTTISNILNDSQQRINENNNLIKAPKLPPEMENAIDESNYVNLNDITAKCKVMSSDFTRNAQKPTDIVINGMEMSSQNHMNVIDNKNNLLNSFYLQINSTSPLTNGYSTSKPVITIVNQKNFNNLNNNCSLAKNTLNNVSNNNSSSLSNGFATNANSFNSCNNNNNNVNSNCNGVLNDNLVDAKTTTGVDYNKNGLPVVSTTTHMQNDVANGHQMQCANKNGISNNVTSPTYVIHNGNGLLTNGNNGIKELSRIDSNKGMYMRCWFFSHLHYIFFALH